MTAFSRPGPLREAHAHIVQHGRAMMMTKLEPCSTRDDCLERLARAAQRTPRGRWALAGGMRSEAWSDPRWLTAADLDAATGDTPVCAWSFDYHMLVVNSAAMRALRIDASTPDPQNGRIDRDKKRNPTGVMLEAAAKMVWSRVPEPSAPERAAQVQRALTDFARHGFDEVHDLLAPAWLGRFLAGLHDRGQLPLRRIYLYCRPEDLDSQRRSRSHWERPGLRFGGLKLFADGTLNSRTAFMLKPYADPHPRLRRGQQMLTTQQIATTIRSMRRAGLGTAIHAIGDAAVRTALDAAELALTKTWPRRAPGSDLPTVRIEHAEIIDHADVPRFAKLGVVCSVQPCHLLADVEALRRGVPERLDRVLPLRELIDSGCTPGELLWFGSDAPIVRPHPRDSIQAAVRRRRSSRDEPIAPEQAITQAEAWACFGATPKKAQRQVRTK